jgi:hypothetical protein
MMRNANDDFLSNHIKASCRELESKLWTNYVGEDYLLDKVLAYHWSKKSDGDRKTIDSFNTSVKLKYDKSNWKIISVYILVLWALSIVFNLTSSILWDICK